MKDELIEKAKNWVSSIYSNADHTLRTGYWVKKLSPDANEALIIAAVTHDVERAFEEDRKPPSPELKGAKWDDPVYNSWHSRRSAKFVKHFLEEEGANEELIDEVVKLISVHEEGGWKEADILRDADSISFLEINVPLFLSRIPEKLSKEEVKDKFDYMYNRIGSKKAKEFAKPYFERSMSLLDKVDET